MTEKVLLWSGFVGSREEHTLDGTSICHRAPYTQIEYVSIASATTSMYLNGKHKDPEFRINTGDLSSVGFIISDSLINK